MRTEQTGERTRRARAPKRVLRGWAFVAGAASFAVPWVALSAVPRPPAAPQRVTPQVIDIRKVTRRIVIHDPAHTHVVAGSPPVRYVYVGGSGGGGGGGGGSVHTHCSTC
jgi:hypothetical protein